MGSLIVLGAIGCEVLPTEELDPIETGDGDAGTAIDPVDPPPSEQPIDGGLPLIDSTIVDSATPIRDGAPPTETHDASPPTDTHDASPPASPSAAFTSVFGVIMASCQGCHGAGKTLDLSTPELAHAGMVGASAKYAACASEGGSAKILVVAGSPETSLLIEKLDGVPSCGKQMPPKALLNVEDIELFRSWIASGAEF